MDKYRKPHKKLSSQVYDEIKGDIITMKLAPGTVLKETELGEQYGLSRTPIREALKQLKSDTFVIYDHDAGNRVAPFSIENYCEIFQIREAIELLPVRLAALNATDAEIAKLEENIYKQKILVSEGIRTMSEILALDREFHTIVAQISGNSRIPPMIEIYYDLCARYNLYCAHEGKFVYIVTEHEYIFKEIYNRDVYAALDKMNTHMTNLNELILLRLSQKLMLKY